MFIEMKLDGDRPVLDIKTENGVDLYALRKFKEENGMIKVLGLDFEINFGKSAPSKVVIPKETKIEPKEIKAAPEKKLEPAAGFYDDRDLLKEKLLEMGVEFNARTRLPGLQKIYDDAISGKAPAADPAPEKEETSDIDGMDFLDAPGEPAAKATIQDVRDSLIAITKKLGPAKAKGVLEEFGVKRVSDLGESVYGKVVESAERVLN